MPKSELLRQKLRFIPLPERCSLDGIILVLIHGQGYYIFIQRFTPKAGAVFILPMAVQTLREWCYLKKCMAAVHL